MCLFLVTACASALPIYVVWGPTNFGTFMQARASGTVNLFSTTADGGMIDIAVTNTSLLYHNGSTYANAFFGTLDFNCPAGFTLDGGASSVKTLGTNSVRFSNGKLNPVVISALDKTLDWAYNTHGSHGTFEATNHANNNTIWSSNALVGGIPKDSFNNGKFEAAYTGAVFDVVHFYVEVKGGNRPLMASDLDMYINGNLTIHWQGGGGSIWDTNSGSSDPNTGIPEPSTLLLLVGGAMAVGTGIIRRKLYK